MKTSWVGGWLECHYSRKRGWRDIKQAERYTRAVAQKTLAGKAMQRSAGRANRAQMCPTLGIARIPWDKTGKRTEESIIRVGRPDPDGG